jgi:hypothetical protein
VENLVTAKAKPRLTNTTTPEQHPEDMKKEARQCRQGENMNGDNNLP